VKGGGNWAGKEAASEYKKGECSKSPKKKKLLGKYSRGALPEKKPKRLDQDE